jgi:hypothetical protein
MRRMRSVTSICAGSPRSVCSHVAHALQTYVRNADNQFLMLAQKRRGTGRCHVQQRPSLTSTATAVTLSRGTPTTRKCYGPTPTIVSISPGEPSLLRLYAAQHRDNNDIRHITQPGDVLVMRYVPVAVPSNSPIQLLLWQFDMPVK